MDYYDSIAEGYNKLHAEEQKKKFMIIRDNVSMDKSMKMLDVGCGTFISRDFFDCDVFGIESSGRMVEQHPKYNELSKKNLFVANAEEIPNIFKENFFDVVICVTSAHHFDDFGNVINGIKKVAKPDAHIVFSLLKSSSLNGLLDSIRKSLSMYKKVDEGKDLIVFCT